LGDECGAGRFDSFPSPDGAWGDSIFFFDGRAWALA
jgi:hypothetical protein